MSWVQTYRAAGAVLVLLSSLALNGCEPANDTIRIVFYADVQAEEGRGVPRAMPLVAAAINAEKPDLVIAGGDLIGGGLTVTPQQARARWAIYDLLRTRIVAPVYSAVGNHDLVRAPGAKGDSDLAARSLFLEQTELDRSYYAFDAHGLHFIILDSIALTTPGHEFRYTGAIDPSQRTWLTAHLEELDLKTPIVVVTHLPLLSVYPVIENGWSEPVRADRVIEDGAELLALFDGHNLQLVLQGHLHVFESIEWGKTTFVTGGAVSGNWWKGDRLGTDEGFCVIDYDNGRVDVRYVGYGWDPPAD